MSKNENFIISHWHQSFEGLQESPKEIYKSIEAAVAKRELPETSTSSVNYYEGGPLSAQREYLRVSRRDLVFDICAAHFGKGMFVSWWLSEDRSTKGIGILILILFIALVLLSIFINQFGFFAGLFLESLVLCVLFFIVSWNVRKGTIKIEDTLLEVPVIGAIYDRLFHPVTYYKTDTALMFQESVRKAVNEVLDGITTAKGLKALTEDERKPILTNLFKR
jgi:hypothetical protein